MRIALILLLIPSLALAGVRGVLAKENLTAADSAYVEAFTPAGYNPWAENYDPDFTPLFLPPDDDGYLPQAYFATIYVDAVYAHTGTDDTLSFFRALVNYEGGGNTIIFEDMGSPWLIQEGALKLFGFNDVTIQIEGEIKLNPGDWADGTVISYLSLSDMEANFPSRSLGSTGNTTRNAKLIWFLEGGNVTIKGGPRGGKITGSYPTDNPPSLPSFTYEFGHAIQFESASGTIDNVTISNLEISYFSGDAVEANQFNGMLIERCYFHHNKRNNLSPITGNNLTVRHSKFDYAGGTDPQMGVDFEPNIGGQQLTNISFEDCSFEGNNDHGIGTALFFADGTAAGDDLTMTWTDLYLKNNNVNPATGDGALKFQGADQDDASPFSDPYTGTLTLNGVVVDGDPAHFAFFRKNNADYNVDFINCAGINLLQSGSAKVIEYIAPDAAISGATMGNVTFTSLLLEYGFDVSPIDLEKGASMDNWANITGNITVQAPGSSPVITYSGSAYNTANNVNVTVTQDRYSSLPATTVSVAVTTASAVESTGQNAVITFTRSSADTSFPMPVVYAITESGTRAEYRKDWVGLNGVAVIPAGSTTVTETIEPINNGVADSGTRSITATILERNVYTIGSGTAATVFLLDTPSAGGSVPASATQKNTNAVLISGK